MSYSFTENTALQLLQQAPRLVPGIAKVVAIYYEPADRTLKAHYLDKPREGDYPEPFTIAPALHDAIKKLRKETTSFDWCRKEELPFEQEKPKVVKIEMFKETDANVLVVPFENEFDKHNDLLLFYFTDNLYSLFQVSNSRKLLSSDQKKIIGNLLMNSLRIYANQCRRDRDVLRDVNLATSSVIEHYRETQEELRRMAAGSQRNTVDLARHFLEEMTPPGGVHYTLTQAATEKLKKFKGDIPELKTILEKAVTFASAISFEAYLDEIRIDEIHIDLNILKNASRSAGIITVPSVRYAKTMILLDKLEEAAVRVVNKHEDLTGANVGRACSKSISAPAITDALKKHKNKINTLLDEFPDRWKLIREEFKPLINILSPKNLRSKKEEHSAS
jgi:hypothetical protein